MEASSGLAACLVAWVPCIAAAQMLAVDDYGAYAARRVGDVVNPDAASGKTEVFGDPVLLDRTHEICATLGTRFGFRFHWSGNLPKARVPLDIRIAHPPIVSWRGGTVAEDHLSIGLGPGQSTMTGWVFRDPRKLKAGNWRFSIFHGGKLLLDQSFHISVNCAPPIA